jgi:hypothetical protein
MNHKAILNLYPQVTNIIDDNAFDIDGKSVEIDAALVNAWQDHEAYKYLRAKEYPPITDYLDGVVKGDQAQIQAYIDDCLAVKAKYPKGT